MYIYIYIYIYIRQRRLLYFIYLFKFSQIATFMLNKINKIYYFNYVVKNTKHDNSVTVLSWQITFCSFWTFIILGSLDSSAVIRLGYRWRGCWFEFYPRMKFIYVMRSLSEFTQPIRLSVSGVIHRAGTPNTGLCPSLIGCGQWLPQRSGWKRYSMCLTQTVHKRSSHMPTSPHLHQTPWAIYAM